MSDRQLLEDAARAAGYNDALALNPYWNPLTDDGDALRLAVKLNLEIVQFRTTVRVSNLELVGDDCHEEKEPDPYAATRRAITRAAAELWRAQQEGRTDG